MSSQQANVNNESLTLTWDLWHEVEVDINFFVWWYRRRNFFSLTGKLHIHFYRHFYEICRAGSWIWSGEADLEIQVKRSEKERLIQRERSTRKKTDEEISATCKEDDYDTDTTQMHKENKRMVFDYILAAIYSCVVGDQCGTLQLVYVCVCEGDTMETDMINHFRQNTREKKSKMISVLHHFCGTSRKSRSLVSRTWFPTIDVCWRDGSNARVKLCGCFIARCDGYRERPGKQMTSKTKMRNTSLWNEETPSWRALVSVIVHQKESNIEIVCNEKRKLHHAFQLGRIQSCRAQFRIRYQSAICSEKTILSGLYYVRRVINFKWDIVDVVEYRDFEWHLRVLWWIRKSWRKRKEMDAIWIRIRKNGKHRKLLGMMLCFLEPNVHACQDWGLTVTSAC